VLVGSREVFFEVDLYGEEFANVYGLDPHPVFLDCQFDAALEVITLGALDEAADEGALVC